MTKPTQNKYVLKLPMRLRISSNKKHALNLNVYRNLHYRSLTALKHKAQKVGSHLIREKKIPPLGRIQLEYEVFARTRREFDVANVCSIVDKFFSDTLTHCGIIEDDNWKYLDKVSFGFGGFASEEYVLVTITEIEPRKGNDMRILLDEDEIQSALEAFVETMGLKGVSGVDLSADEDGNISAEVLMGEAKPKPKATRSKGGRPLGSKNKPKEPEENVETSTDGSTAGAGTTSSKPSTKDESTEDSGKEAKGSPTKGEEEAKSKNLFGDEETKSSKSDAPEESTKEDSSEAPKPKKSSIFDQ